MESLSTIYEYLDYGVVKLGTEPMEQLEANYHRQRVMDTVKPLVKLVEACQAMGVLVFVDFSGKRVEPQLITWEISLASGLTSASFWIPGIIGFVVHSSGVIDYGADELGFRDLPNLISTALGRLKENSNLLERVAEIRNEQAGSLAPSLGAM